MFLQIPGIEYGIVGVALLAVGGAFWRLVQKGISIWEKMTVEHAENIRALNAENTETVRKLVAEKDELNTQVVAICRESVSAITANTAILQKCDKREQAAPR